MTIATTTLFAAGNGDVEHQVDALRLRVRRMAHRFIHSGPDADKLAAEAIVKAELEGLAGLDLRALEFRLFELMREAVLQ